MSRPRLWAAAEIRYRLRKIRVKEPEVVGHAVPNGKRDTFLLLGSEADYNRTNQANASRSKRNIAEGRLVANA